MRRHSSGYDLLFFAAIVATLISLSPALAHLFELPHKMTLPANAYFTVQQIYAGWDLFGLAIVAQFILLLLLTIRSAREYFVFRPVLLALVLLIAAQVLFWGLTFPANAATHDWTFIPPDWQALRRQWEYGHAASALLVFGALLATGRAIIGSRRTG